MASKTTRTATEKKAYVVDLRTKWTNAKALADTMSEVDALGLAQVRAIMPAMSATGYIFIACQMSEQGLTGLPGLDALTFQGWKARGFMVRKWEKSTLAGITWISAKGKEATETTDWSAGFLFPKTYHLFHSSQVEPIDMGDYLEAVAEGEIEAVYAL